MLKNFTLIFLIYSSQLIAQIQDSSHIVIPSSYSFSMESPKIMRAGQIIKFEADSIYLVNKARLSFYEELRIKLVTLDFDCEPTIELYKKSLNQNSLFAQQLLENSEITNRLNANIVFDSRLLLDKNNAALNLTLENLNSANENLELAKSELSKMRQNSFLGNFLYTLAGIGIGVIVGVSIN